MLNTTFLLKDDETQHIYVKLSTYSLNAFNLTTLKRVRVSLLEECIPVKIKIEVKNAISNR